MSAECYRRQSAAVSPSNRFILLAVFVVGNSRIALFAIFLVHSWWSFTRSWLLTNFISLLLCSSLLHIRLNAVTTSFLHALPSILTCQKIGNFHLWFTFSMFIWKIIGISSVHFDKMFFLFSLKEEDMCRNLSIKILQIFALSALYLPWYELVECLIVLIY